MLFFTLKKRSQIISRTMIAATIIPMISPILGPPRSAGGVVGAAVGLGAAVGGAGVAGAGVVTVG